MTAFSGDRGDLLPTFIDYDTALTAAFQTGTVTLCRVLFCCFFIHSPAKATCARRDAPGISAQAAVSDVATRARRLSLAMSILLRASTLITKPCRI